MTTPFTVTVGSAFEGGAERTFTVTTPLDARSAYEPGTAYPTAQQIADAVAADYCDSGDITVAGGGQRALVGRRLLSP